jgi:hypothetical protein
LGSASGGAPGPSELWSQPCVPLRAAGVDSQRESSSRAESAERFSVLSLKHRRMATLRAGGPLASGPHDVGGVPRAELGPDPEAYFVANTARRFQQWEREVVAMIRLIRDQIWSDGEPVLYSWDPIRRAIEGLPKPVYDATAYFEKWALGFAMVLIDRGVMNSAELGEKLGMGESAADGSVADTSFAPGDAVVVRSEDLATAWQKPHLRTPGYIFGKAGVVERICGSFENPELLAIGLRGKSEQLYRVRFRQSDVWAEYVGHPEDSIDVEAYAPWLERTTVASNFSCGPPLRNYLAYSHSHPDGSEAAGHSAEHAARAEIEQQVKPTFLSLKLTFLSLKLNEQTPSILNTLWP